MGDQEDIKEISVEEEEEKENSDEYESSREQERVAREVTSSFPDMFRTTVSTSNSIDLRDATTTDLTVASNIDVVIDINPDAAGVMEGLKEQVGQINQSLRDLANRLDPRVCGVATRYVKVCFSVAKTAYSVAKEPATTLAAFIIIKRFFEGHSPLASMLASTGDDLQALVVPAAREDKDKDEERAVVREWLHPSAYPNMPQEAAFWENLAVYVDHNKPRPYDEQLIFMQYTMELARHMMTDKFQWATAVDKVGVIGELASVLSARGLAAMYRRIPQIAYRGMSLPRAVAANLASHAIIQWQSEQ